jgi:hypothetical protein
VNIKRYCEIDTEKQYEIRGIDASNSQFNLFVKSCIGEVVHLIGKKQGGTRCTDCMNYWTLNSSRLKKITKQRNKGIIHSQQCIIKPELTDEDYSGLVNFTHTDKKLSFTCPRRPRRKIVQKDTSPDTSRTCQRHVVDMSWTLRLFTF